MIHTVASRRCRRVVVAMTRVVFEMPSLDINASNSCGVGRKGAAPADCESSCCEETPLGNVPSLAALPHVDKGVLSVRCCASQRRVAEQLGPRVHAGLRAMIGPREGPAADSITMMTSTAPVLPKLHDVGGRILASRPPGHEHGP